MAQHVCGRDLTLTLSDRPMFDTNVFARMGIGPADDVAGGKNMGIIGLQARIDKDAAILS